MIECERAEELIPWYVAGSLPDDESGELAMHLSTCDQCRAELARVVPLVMDLQMALGTLAGAPESLRERVAEGAKRSGAPGIDVGSFLLGLSMGMSATGKGAPIQGDLRILGRKVPLFRLQQGGPNRD
jgi:anti-sigma factor RsiW